MNFTPNELKCWLDIVKRKLSFWKIFKGFSTAAQKQWISWRCGNDVKNDFLNSIKKCCLPIEFFDQWKNAPKWCQKEGSQINPIFVCRNSTILEIIFSSFRQKTKHLPIFPSIKNHSSLPRNKSSLWQRVFFWLFSINLLALKRCYIARLVRRNERVKRFNFYPEIPLTTVMPKMAQSFAV